MIKTYPAWQQQPLRLSAEEMANANQVLNDFFDYDDLPAHRERLWEVLNAALSGSFVENVNGKKAGEWVFYFRQLEKLIEAGYVMQQRALEETPLGH